MTYEELKAEAHRMGYHLIKNAEPISLLPCICGGKRRQSWSSPQGGFLKCVKCGRKGGYAKTARGEKLAWNEMIRNAMAEGRAGAEKAD